jgi:hypothetical protein
MVGEARNMIKSCSKDARKIIKNYPELEINIFMVERALFKSYPVSFNRLYKKERDLDKIFSMIWNGYFKNINRNMTEPLWDEILFHYMFLIEEYLITDFNYNALVALNDIKSYGFDLIRSTIRKIKVKDLWYLRKVLLGQNTIIDEPTYKHLDTIKPQKQGKPIKFDFGVDSEQFKYN